MKKAPGPRIDVIVSTYERPDALLATLASLDAQRSRAFRVIVADDGSGPRTREAVERFAASTDLEVRHVWHEDEGFRLAAIRNKAVAVGDAPYIVLIDGDIVVRDDFVEKHAELAEPGHFVRGSRVRIGRELTEWSLETGEPLHAWTRGQWLRARLAGKIDRFLPFLHLPLGPLRKFRGRNRDNAAGVNLGMWREDLVAVNGFDEVFTAYGLEDLECLDRMIRRGVRRKNGRLFSFPILHLWHPQRTNDPESFALLRESRAEGRERATVGLDRHLR